MPVNLADMQTLGAVLAAPILAAAVGVSREAGWLIPFYIVGGCALGLMQAWLMRWLAYDAVPYKEGDGALREWLSAFAYLSGPPLIGVGVWVIILSSL